MSSHPSPHPTPESLHAFFSGRMDEHEALVVESHLNHCADCQGQLDSAPNLGDPFIERLQQIHRGPDSSFPPLPISPARLSHRFKPLRTPEPPDNLSDLPTTPIKYPHKTTPVPTTTPMFPKVEESIFLGRFRFWLRRHPNLGWMTAAMLLLALIGTVAWPRRELPVPTPDVKTFAPPTKVVAKPPELPKPPKPAEPKPEKVASLFPWIERAADIYWLQVPGSQWIYGYAYPQGYPKTAGMRHTEAAQPTIDAEKKTLATLVPGTRRFNRPALQLWNARTGEAIGRPASPPLSLRSIAKIDFSSDGKEVWVTDIYASTSVYEISSARFIEKATGPPATSNNLESNDHQVLEREILDRSLAVRWQFNRLIDADSKSWWLWAQRAELNWGRDPNAKDYFLTAKKFAPPTDFEHWLAYQAQTINTVDPALLPGHCLAMLIETSSRKKSHWFWIRATGRLHAGQHADGLADLQEALRLERNAEILEDWSHQLAVDGQWRWTREVAQNWPEHAPDRVRRLALLHAQLDDEEAYAKLLESLDRPGLTWKERRERLFLRCLRPGILGDAKVRQQELRMLREDATGPEETLQADMLAGVFAFRIGDFALAVESFAKVPASKVRPAMLGFQAMSLKQLGRDDEAMRIVQQQRAMLKQLENALPWEWLEGQLVRQEMEKSPD